MANAPSAQKKRDLQDMILECGKCKTVWKEVFLVPMACRAFVDRMKAWSCINCGNKRNVYILTGKKYFEAKAKLEA